MEIDFDLKVRLFKEHLENGGLEKINSISFLEDLKKVRITKEGKAIRETISPLIMATINAYTASQLYEPYLLEDHISEYETLLQKSIFFKQENIEDEKDFDEIFEAFKDRKNTLFRGLIESKYRLYNLLQRKWINEKIYQKNISLPEFLKQLVNTARGQQNNVITKLFSISGFDPDNDLAVLSFLQHHRCPTPLLDWTYSFPVALFFATEGIHSFKTTKEIDNYFCVCYLEENFISKNSIKEIVEEELAKHSTTFKDRLIENLVKKGADRKVLENIYTPAISEKFVLLSYGSDAITHATKIDSLKEHPILYFSDFEDNFIIHYYLNNNLNIINQQGAFTWNSHPSRPLEQVAFDAQKADTKDENLNYRFSKCININKQLAKYVRMKLKKIGITKKFIYPNPYQIAKQTFSQTLNMY